MSELITRIIEAKKALVSSELRKEESKEALIPSEQLKEQWI